MLTLRHLIFGVKDANLGLFPLFTDNFRCLLIYTERANYIYFHAHKDIDYYVQ